MKTSPRPTATGEAWVESIRESQGDTAAEELRDWCEEFDRELRSDGWRAPMHVLDIEARLDAASDAAL